MWLIAIGLILISVGSIFEGIKIDKDIEELKKRIIELEKANY